MARFYFPYYSSNGSSSNGTWAIAGGTVDPDTLLTTTDQPTFNGDPLFTGNWSRIGELCNFAIQVDMDNITSFGTGQYFVELPFNADDEDVFAGGHLHDDNTGDFYSILGHVFAGTNLMTLWSVASNGRQVPFTNGVPITLGAADSFTINGTFHIEPGSPYLG
jgi:hypothetical protein